MFFGGARWVRYHQTKLANAVFVHTLAEKLKAKGSKVKALCAAPGLAATNLQVTTANDGGFSSSFIMRWAQSAEDGTMSLLQCCAAPGVESGELWEPSVMTGPTHRVAMEKICTDPKAGKTLWEESEKACGAWAL